MQEKKEYIISARNKFSFGIKELIDYQELIYIFTWREIKVKYKQTAIGIFWVVLQPLLLMGIINVFLSRLFQSHHYEVPYYLYVYSGLITWTLFSSSANTAVNNILTSANIIKKIYFPRLIIPLSSVLASLLDFVISFVVLIVFITIDDFYLLSSFNVLYWILSVMVVMMFSLALGLYFSALVVKYRDFRYALPFFIQLLFFISPVIYSIHLPNATLQEFLFYFNPMILGMDIMRKAIFGINIQWSTMQILISFFVLSVYLLMGIYTFRKTEEYIADKI